MLHVLILFAIFFALFRVYGWQDAAIAAGLYAASSLAMQALGQKQRRRQAVRLLNQKLSNGEKAHLLEVQDKQKTGAR